jgi:hypothetical protein
MRMSSRDAIDTGTKQTFAKRNARSANEMDDIGTSLRSIGGVPYLVSAVIFIRDRQARR